MAGNKNSGNGITFRLNGKELEKRMQDFREQYGEGQHGMVTWPAFCAFLGYSVDDVAECYRKGRTNKNTYTARSKMLEQFATEIKGLTYKTCDRQQALAKIEVQTDYLNSKKDEVGAGAVRVLFGRLGDDRWKDAME